MKRLVLCGFVALCTLRLCALTQEEATQNLRDAVKNNDVAAVKKAITEGADVNVEDDNPLVLAIKGGKKAVFDLLLKEKNINLGIEEVGDEAVRQNDSYYLKELFKHPNLTKEKVKDDWDVAYMLESAISDKKDLVFAQIILDSPLVTKEQVNDGYGILHVAMNGGPTALSKLQGLLAHPKVDVNFIDGSGTTPLQEAIKLKNEFFMEAILSHKDFDPALLLAPVGIGLGSARLARLTDEFAPATLKRFLNSDKITKKLINTPDVNGYTMYTALVDNAKNTDEYKETFKDFVQNNKFDVNETDSNGNTPLHINPPFDGAIDLLLACKPSEATINAKNKDGDTPAHIFVERGDVVTVGKLLKAGAANNVKNAKGETIVEMAHKSGNKQLIERIAQQDVLNKRLLDAAQKGDEAGVKNAIDDGAYINVQDANGNTAAHLASQVVDAGKSGVVLKLLKNSGASTTISNNSGVTVASLNQKKPLQPSGKIPPKSPLKPGLGTTNVQLPKVTTMNVKNALEDLAGALQKLV